jgi:hypothetical protein
MTATRKDLLLEWASERGEGSWSRFRDAYAWLEAGSDAPPWQSASLVARQMSALGHIEIDWRASRWQACPPLLTLLPAAGAHALLTGGRTRALEERLAEVLADRGDVFALDPIAQPLAPSTLLIACDDERAMRSLADSLGIASSYSAATGLSSVLPSIGSYLSLAGTAPAPRGYGVQRLSLDSLTWTDVDHDDEDGLYRFEAPDGRRFRFVSSGSHYEVDMAIGIYASLGSAGERGRLKWFRSSVNGQFESPRQAPLPTLHARSLTLCSGFAPKSLGSSLVYANVPEEIAMAVARSLDQELIIVG